MRGHTTPVIGSASYWLIWDLAKLAQLIETYMDIMIDCHELGF